ncbi:MAG: sigma-54 dependent transcriptional regulator [Bacteroidota bacterium]
MSVQAIKQRFGVIGRSEGLDRALDKAMRVANTDLTVLILGESGVGKEVISKIIHQLSSRKHSNFIAINTGALPEGTINSELFGHEKGAFTGATSDRKGYFETATGGTIFLDEIGEMPLDTQSYLLRVLESGEFIRVGSSSVQKTDVRVVAATNVDLLTRVREGKFREDLYYRLNTVPIKVPALRERREDIYMIFRKFSLDFAEKYRTEPIQLAPEAKTLLTNYSWPGNIRELRNVVEQLAILTEEKLITVGHLVEILPDINRRNLPKIADGKDDGLQERELLYKVLFDMKKDLNDLKSLIFELIRKNDLEVGDIANLRQLQLGAGTATEDPIRPRFDLNDLDDQVQRSSDYVITSEEADVNSPVLIQDGDYDDSEVVEENLSLEIMEREFIGKALKKHHGRRKEAAHELGISERTLYRKIKYYDM